MQISETRLAAAAAAAAATTAAASCHGMHLSVVELNTLHYSAAVSTDELHADYVSTSVHRLSVSKRLQ